MNSLDTATSSCHPVLASWPCLGQMSSDELDAEWLRCWTILKAGDREIKAGYWLSNRVRSIEEVLLDRQFLRDNDARLRRGEIFPNGAAAEQWRFDKFMHKEP